MQVNYYKLIRELTISIVLYVYKTTNENRTRYNLCCHVRANVDTKYIRDKIINALANKFLHYTVTTRRNF